MEIINFPDAFYFVALFLYPPEDITKPLARRPVAENGLNEEMISKIELWKSGRATVEDCCYIKTPPGLSSLCSQSKT